MNARFSGSVLRFAAYLCLGTLVLAVAPRDAVAAAEKIFNPGSDSAADLGCSRDQRATAE